MKFSLALVISCILLLQSIPGLADELDDYKATCKEIGFKPGTEKFGDCVLKLRGKDLNKTLHVNQVPNNQQPISVSPPSYIEPPIYIQNNDYSNELARQALEETKAARAEAQRQRAIDNLRELHKEQEEKRKADTQQMLQFHQQTIDANQKKIDNDWGIVR